MKIVPTNRFVQWIAVFMLAATTTVLAHTMLPEPPPTGGYVKKDTVPAIAARSVMANPSIPAAETPIPPSVPARPLEKPAPRPLSDRIAEYHMSVELNAKQKSLSGQQTLTWKNPGSRPVGELYFHLYPNAFESKKTTFMRESGGQLRNDKMKGDSFGSMQITAMKTIQGDSLMDRMEFVQPDDGNKDDRTLLKVTLPKAIGPGEEITLETGFIVKLPEVFARMGYIGDFVMAGQWFPKVAVYEPAGTRGRTDEGWNAHQYHGNSEFYADFGIYDVKIKVPSKYTVAATGFPTKPAQDDGATKTYMFYADDVHDFAWSASPNFVYYEEPYATAKLPGVKIKLYLDPKHEPLKARYMAAAKKSLARYSDWYGTYPYSTLSIVVPPQGGNGAGGMEYPTLITGWAADEEKPDFELERVLVHEIGHQFWYGMVASNEFEEAWLDEGFTSYTEDRLMETEYGVRPNLPVESSYMTDPAPLKMNSWEYKSHDHYAENVYTRSKLVLKALEKQIGPDAMERVLKAYFQQWKFKHPTTADFQRIVEETTKANWNEFFEQYVFGGLMTDFAVDGIRIKKLPSDLTLYESTVLIRKYGGTYGHVPIRFHFTDGTTIDKVWEGKERETQFKLTHTAPVDWAFIDPDRTIVLENKQINGFMRTNVDTKAALRWNVGSVRVIETLFSWLAW